MREEAYKSGPHQTKLLFLGGEGGVFRDVTEEAGYAIQDERMGRGAAFGDLDADGGVDVAVTNKNGEAQVLVNKLPERGNWVILDLRAPAPNVFGVGARVRVRAGGRIWTREVYAGTSYLSGDDLGLHFGLGDITSIDSVDVRWPDGTVKKYTDIEINRRQTLTK